MLLSQYFHRTFIALKNDLKNRISSGSGAHRCLHICSFQKFVMTFSYEQIKKSFHLFPMGHSLSPKAKILML